MLSTLLLLTAVFARSNFGPETNDIHHSIVHSNVNQLTSFSSSTDHVTDAKLYAASVLGLSAEDFIVTDDYASGNLRHVYLQQVYNGIPVANGHGNYY